jgi:hypothetical protein
MKKNDINNVNKNCPRCGNPALSITYGLPTEEDFNDPSFYSGGCIIMPDQPDWACPDCEIEFE